MYIITYFDCISHWADIYADRESVVVLLSQLQDDKYNAVVERIAKKLTEAYPNSEAVRNFNITLNSHIKFVFSTNKTG